MLCGLLGLVVGACGSSAKTSTGTSPATTSTTAAPMASQCAPGTGLTKTATTASYTMVLDANASEAMYTQAQVAAQHPKTGEVMLRGQMNPMGGSGTSNMTSTTMMGTATTMMATATTMAHAPMTTTPMGHSPNTTTTTAMGNTSNTQMATPGMGGADVRHLEVRICSRATGKVVQNAQPTITVVDNTSNGMSDHVPVAAMEGIGAGVADLHYGNNVTMPAMHRYTVTVTLNGEKAVFNFTRPS